MRLVLTPMAGMATDTGREYGSAGVAAAPAAAGGGRSPEPPHIALIDAAPACPGSPGDAGAGDPGSGIVPRSRGGAGACCWDSSPVTSRAAPSSASVPATPAHTAVSRPR